MKRMLTPLWLCLLLAALCLPMQRAQAQVSTNAGPLEFTSSEEEARFHALSQQLRCVMCQNQSLADSNAEIARDLRAEVLALMRQGKTDAQVKAFLVQRYGEFVLYRPQVKPGTWLLWFGPLLLLLAGAGVLVIVVKRRSQNTPAQTPDNAHDPHHDW